MELQQLADGIWIIDGESISFLSFPYEIRCTVIEVGGKLLIHSPVQLSASKYLERLPGNPGYIVSPNKLHSLFLADWQKAFPEVKFYAPPGLSRKLKKVSFAGQLSDVAEPEWEKCLKQKIVRGSWFMSEVVFFHIPSKTLILGDLIENHNPDKLNWLYRFIAKINEMLAPAGTTARVFRWTFIHRRQARADLEEILGWGAERVIVNHGPVVDHKAEEFLKHAFRWLL